MVSSKFVREISAENREDSLIATTNLTGPDEHACVRVYVYVCVNQETAVEIKKMSTRY